jgi:hypothetical protein
MSKETENNNNWLDTSKRCSLCVHHSEADGYEDECGDCCHFYGDHFEAEE